MKKLVLLLAAVVLISSGCASHSHRVKGDARYLHLKRPHARVVSFACSLDGYGLRKAEKIGRATWRVAVPAGLEFRYFYIVDGVVYLPPCRRREKDDFGSENCIYVPNM